MTREGALSYYFVFFCTTFTQQQMSCGGLRECGPPRAQQQQQLVIPVIPPVISPWTELVKRLTTCDVAEVRKIIENNKSSWIAEHLNELIPKPSHVLPKHTIGHGNDGYWYRALYQGTPVAVKTWDSRARTFEKIQRAGAIFALFASHPTPHLEHILGVFVHDKDQIENCLITELGKESLHQLHSEFTIHSYEHRLFTAWQIAAGLVSYINGDSSTRIYLPKKFSSVKMGMRSFAAVSTTSKLSGLLEGNRKETVDDMITWHLNVGLRIRNLRQRWTFLPSGCSCSK